MKVKKALIGCEFSGRVRKAFARRGCFAMSCDFLPTEQPCGPNEAHYQGDVLEALKLEQWDIFIAHPECTFLCGSGLHWNNNPNSPRFGGAQTEEAFAFFMTLWNANVKRKALENPVGCISSRFRKPNQIIQPYEFGADASKKTCLWTDNLPNLIVNPFNRIKGRIVEYPKGSGKLVERWSNQTDSGQNKLSPGENRWKDRSETYIGIAEAMGERWVPVL